MKEHIVMIICAVVALIAFAFGRWTGVMDNEIMWRNLAIDRGYAEYFLDEKHERQWRWKEAKP